LFTDILMLAGELLDASQMLKAFPQTWMVMSCEIVQTLHISYFILSMLFTDTVGKQLHHYCFISHYLDHNSLFKLNK